MIVKRVTLKKSLNNQQKAYLSMLGTLYKTFNNSLTYLDVDDNLTVHKEDNDDSTNGAYFLNGTRIFSNWPNSDHLVVYDSNICDSLKKTYTPYDPNQEKNEIPVPIRIELQPNDIQKIFLEALGTITTKNNTTYLEVKESHRAYKFKNSYYFNGVPVFSISKSSNALFVDPQAICHALTKASKYTEKEALSFESKLDKYDEDLTTFNYVSELKEKYDIFDEARKGCSSANPSLPAMVAKTKLFALRTNASQLLFDTHIQSQRKDKVYEHNLSWKGKVPSAPVKPCTLSNASVPQSIIDKLVALIDKKIEKLNETSGWIIAKSPKKVAALNALKETLTNGNCPSFERLSTTLKDWSTQQKDVIDAHRNRFYMFSLKPSATNTRNMVNDLESTLKCKLG